MGIGGDAEAPLAHKFALDGVAATNRESVDHFVVGEDCAKFSTPVDGYVGKVCQTVIHQYLLTACLVPAVPFLGGEVHSLCAGGIETFGALLGKTLLKGADWQRLVLGVVVIVLEKLEESPLRPFVIFRVTCAYLTIPVETETYLVELFAVAVDVLLSCLGRVLTCLDGILLGGEAVGVVAHWVQHVESAQAFVACVYVAGDVAERVADMETCSRRIGEHVEHIKMRFRGIVFHMVGLPVAPELLPFGFDFGKIVVHLSLFL